MSITSTSSMSTFVAVSASSPDDGAAVASSPIAVDDNGDAVVSVDGGSEDAGADGDVEADVTGDGEGWGANADGWGSVANDHDCWGPAPPATLATLEGDVSRVSHALGIVSMDTHRIESVVRSQGSLLRSIKPYTRKGNALLLEDINVSYFNLCSVFVEIDLEGQKSVGRDVEDVRHRLKGVERQLDLHMGIMQAWVASLGRIERTMAQLERRME